MFVIVGLGNPTKQYEGTRHNAGFEAIDEIGREYQIPIKTAKHKALVGKGMIHGQPVMLVKPQTYMNLSGESVGEIIRFYQVDPTSELIVISDDITLSTGTIRIRRKGSAGGHNGLKSIINHCQTSEFSRIKIGVGDVKNHGDLIAHVLGTYSKEDKKRVEATYQWVADAVATMVEGNEEKAMNHYNGKVVE